MRIRVFKHQYGKPYTGKVFGASYVPGYIPNREKYYPKFTGFKVSKSAKKVMMKSRKVLKPTSKLYNKKQAATKIQALFRGRRLRNFMYKK